MASNSGKITISDVAQAAGVSKQTVSRVINDRPDVAKSTRNRVLTLIHEMGYQPDPIARSMKGRTHTLGCITPNLADPIFSIIVEYAQSEARRQGFFVLTGSASTVEEMEPLLGEMLNRRVDGLLVINPREDERYKLLHPLLDEKLPIVYIKNTPGGESVSAVAVDDTKGGYLATKHLLNLGHRRIATIIGPKNEECTAQRLEGYLKAHREVEIETNDSFICMGDWTPKSGNEAIKKLASGKGAFTAVFAQNDRMAVGAVRALRELGYRVPDDISIVGYDDIPLASYFDPPLTTIKQPIDQFGVEGVRMLIEATKLGEHKPKTITLEPQLVERATTMQYHGKKGGDADRK
jgi:DNA-binding LacI/PurR family transcriptional regulator